MDTFYLRVYKVGGYIYNDKVILIFKKSYYQEDTNLEKINKRPTIDTS